MIVRRAPSEDVSPRSPGPRGRRRGISLTGSKPTPDGATELVLDPVKFLKRLTALLARPYVNLVRYHGLFSNRSNDRPRLPPLPYMSPQSMAAPGPGPLHEAAPSCDTQPQPTKRRRSSWARLLKRTLHVDSLTCPRCSEAMVVTAFITDPAVVKKILNHLHLPSADPPRAPARAAPEQFTLDAELGQDFSDKPFPPSSPPQQRGPP